MTTTTTKKLYEKNATLLGAIFFLLPPSDERRPASYPFYTPSPRKQQNGAIDAAGEGGIQRLPGRATPEEGKKKVLFYGSGPKSFEFAICTTPFLILMTPISVAALCAHVR